MTALLDSGEARTKPSSVALTHADGRRWLLVGFGPREEARSERGACRSSSRRRPGARDLDARAVLDRAGGSGEMIAAALVEGTVLADYRFERFKSAPAPDSPAGAGTTSPRLPRGARRRSRRRGRGGRAREPRARSSEPARERPHADGMGEHARALAEEIAELAVEVEGREAIRARGMGAFSAVAQGSAQEPALITMRYEPLRAPEGPVLSFVGKAVTFDSGGISLKPAPKMAEMKFDMSGGAAAIEATAAIAALGLPIRLVTVVGASENLPSGSAVKPGDIVTASNGKTIEVNNTDAEGRLVLADCLCHAVAQGATQIVDLATLTGAVIIALGSTYAGLISNDDGFAELLIAAGEQSGEIVWRLPLHEEYDELIKGRFADLDNAPEARKAGTILGGTFLSNFVGETPWAHLDIAGTAWDLGRPYVGKGASGFGVRLLVALARELSGQ